MRVLFYHGESGWSDTARIALRLADGLSARGHQVTFAACHGGPVEAAARAAQLETAAIDGRATAMGGAFDVHRVLAERFVEVAVVSSERDQLIVSSAMRFADGGTVLRRVPSFTGLTVHRGGRLALRLATAGVVVSTERELHDVNLRGWTMPPMIASIGIDMARYDVVEPAPHDDIGALTQGPIIACSYDRSGRYRFGAVLRTLALLAPRHRPLHIVVFGPGSDDDELRLHTAALGVGSLVTFISPEQDPSPVMRAATAGWVVSSGDVAALACLEFMAMRIPVIMDRSPLAQQYIADGITGMLLSTEDPSLTASALATLLTSDDTRAAMGNEGRARVQRDFPESAMIDGFERAVDVAGDRARWMLR